MNASTSSVPPTPARSSAGQKLLVVLCVFFGIFGIAAAAVTAWYYYNFRAAPFKPVNLSVAEQDTLKSKLAALETGRTSELEPSTPAPGSAPAPHLPSPAPAPPSDPAKTIVLSEREINGWLASQPDLADKVKFHMNNDTVGATILVPVDPSVKYVGGKTIRIKVAFNTKLDADHKLNFSLADVSVGGISLPNAWLNDMKGLNLLADNGPGSVNSEFLQRFAAGIKDLQIRNGELRMVLND